MEKNRKVGFECRKFYNSAIHRKEIECCAVAVITKSNDFGPFEAVRCVLGFSPEDYAERPNLILNKNTRLLWTVLVSLTALNGSSSFTSNSLRVS